MQDETENIRRARVAELNAGEPSRAELEAQHGKLWTTTELTEEFEVKGFMAPFVVVRRKADGALGSLEFTHSPRFYFNWRAD